MDRFRSIRSSSRARTSERGFALALALVLAVLYFGLIELLMIDSSRELAAARRYRARVVAHTLAENAAEAAAFQMANPDVHGNTFSEEDEQGRMSGTLMKAGSPPTTSFVLTGEGVSAGLESTKATVRLQGTIVDKEITIQYAQHSQ